MRTGLWRFVRCFFLKDALSRHIVRLAAISLWLHCPFFACIPGRPFSLVSFVCSIYEKWQWWPWLVICFVFCFHHLPGPLVNQRDGITRTGIMNDLTELIEDRTSPRQDTDPETHEQGHSGLFSKEHSKSMSLLPPLPHFLCCRWKDNEPQGHNWMCGWTVSERRWAVWQV